MLLAVVDVVVVVDEAVDVYVLVEVGIVELVLAELVVVDEVAEVVVDDVAIVVDEVGYVEVDVLAACRTDRCRPPETRTQGVIGKWCELRESSPSAIVAAESAPGLSCTGLGGFRLHGLHGYLQDLHHLHRRLHHFHRCCIGIGLCCCI